MWATNLFDLRCYNFESFHHHLHIKLSAWNANFALAIIFRSRSSLSCCHWRWVQQTSLNVQTRVNEMENILADSFEAQNKREEKKLDTKKCRWWWWWWWHFHFFDPHSAVVMSNEWTSEDFSSHREISRRALLAKSSLVFVLFVKLKSLLDEEIGG